MTSQGPGRRQAVWLATVCPVAGPFRLGNSIEIKKDCKILLSWQLVRTILFMQQLRGVTALNIFLAFRMTRKCKYLNLNLARFNQLRLRVLPDYNIHLHPPPSEMHNIR